MQHTIETVGVYFHLAGQRLGVGSTILPGNFVRIVALVGPQHPAMDREAALESWRAANAPHLPSRAASVFVFDVEADARAFREREPGFAWHLLYRVVPIILAPPVHRARIADFRPASALDRDWPARYWRTHEAPTAEGGVWRDEAMPVVAEAREVLIGRPVRIEACLDEA